MTVPELAEPNTGNGTNESRSVPVLAIARLGTVQMENFRKWNSKKDSTGNGCQYWKWECQFQYWQIARLGTYIFTNKITALKGT
jgi:hypothetical protein